MTLRRVERSTKSSGQKEKQKGIKSLPKDLKNGSFQESHYLKKF